MPLSEDDEDKDDGMKRGDRADYQAGYAYKVCVCDVYSNINLTKL